MSKIFLVALRIIILGSWAILAVAVDKGMATVPEAERSEIPKGWKLFPRIGLGMEYGGFIRRDGDFTSLLRRRLEMDVLQYRRFILYLEFDEATTFGTSQDKWDFNSLRYRLHLGGIRYDLGEHYLGLFYNHWCYNPFLTEKFQNKLDRFQISIYLLTLEFLSKGMRLGMKDRGIVFNPDRPFEFLWKFNYYTSVGKALDQTQNYDLDWVLRGQLRLDLLRFYRLIPYVEVGGELWTGASTRGNPWVEWGIRYHVRRNLDLTPFFQLSREQQIFKGAIGQPPIRRLAQNFLYGGLRLEYLIDSETALPGGDWQFLPEIHGSATYFNYLKSQFFGWGGDIELDLEVLRWRAWTLFFYTDLNLSTERGEFGPDKITGRIQYGLTYTRKPFFIEGFVANRQRLDSIRFSRVMERSNEAGLRVGTTGMKPGHFNDGISFAGPKFQWLNKWNAQAKAAHFFQNRDWQYLWDLTGQARWDILRWHFVVPYVQGELSWMAGGGGTADALQYAVEPGLRFHGVLDLAVYYRFQHQDNARVFRGPSDNQSLIGIKALF
jgi:hypothetical protein